MKLEVFLTEHSPGNAFPKAFWAMPFPAQIEISEISKQTVNDAVQKVFSENAPSTNQIPMGVYFDVQFQQECIFRGHIDSSGRVDSIVKVQLLGAIPAVL